MSLNKYKKNIDMALMSAYEAARQASNAKSAFLSNMSHDIRTPMNAILGMCTIARQHMDDLNRVEDCLDKINASSKHLLNLINAVLDMSKIESGKVVLHESTIRISRMLKEICDIVHPQAAKKNLNFIYSFDGLEDVTVLGISITYSSDFC